MCISTATINIGYSSTSFNHGAISLAVEDAQRQGFLRGHNVRYVMSERERARERERGREKERERGKTERDSEKERETDRQKER